MITGGQVSDVTQAGALLSDKQAEFVLADKGYDSDDLVETLAQQGSTAVIPPRSNRLVKREYDRDLYKDRNLIERFFNRIKHFRRVATRYEKTKLSYQAILFLVSSLILLK